MTASDAKRVFNNWNGALESEKYEAILKFRNSQWLAHNVNCGDVKTAFEWYIDKNITNGGIPVEWLENMAIETRGLRMGTCDELIRWLIRQWRREHDDKG